MATGSYEGPLPMEGIPDHHEALSVTGQRSGWSRRFSHLPTRPNPFKRRADGDEAAHAKACEA
jgi:hypothetical protein